MRRRERPKRHNRRWRPDEDEALRAFAPEYTDRQIGVLLDRTTNAIAARRSLLGISRQAAQPEAPQWEFTAADEGQALAAGILISIGEQHLIPEVMPHSVQFLDEKGTKAMLESIRGVGEPRTGKRNTRIYLAGKIGGEWYTRAGENWNWRCHLVDGLNEPVEYDVDDEWPVLERAVLDYWDYVGPYYCQPTPTLADLGHPKACSEAAFRSGSWTGCLHGVIDRQGHGVIFGEEVVEKCLRAIERADLFFAWLGGEDFHGTLIEIGYAKALGKPIVIASAHENEEWWFAYKCATYPRTFSEMLWNSHSPRSALYCLRSHYQDAESILDFWKPLVCKEEAVG